MFAVGVTASVTSFPNRVVPFPKTQEIHHRTAPFVMVRAFSWWISCVFVRGDGCLPGASEADAGPATNVHGSYETASVLHSHLSAGTVALATISTVAGILTRAAITASIALLARRMLQGRTFWRLLSRTVTIAGAVPPIGGLLTEGVGVTCRVGGGRPAQGCSAHRILADRGHHRRHLTRYRRFTHACRSRLRVQSGRTATPGGAPGGRRRLRDPLPAR